MRRPRGQGGSPARPDRAAGALRRRDESPRAQPAARARPQTRTDDRRLAMIVHMVILKVKKSVAPKDVERVFAARSEEHTSELQSQFHLVCRLLLEKKKNRQKKHNRSE